MDLLSPQLTNTLGLVLTHSVWQITLLAILYGLLRMLVRQKQPETSARLLYGAGSFCLVAMVFAPALTFSWLSSHSRSLPGSSLSLNHPAPSMTWQSYEPELPHDNALGLEAASPMIDLKSEVAEIQALRTTPPEIKATRLHQKPMLWLVIAWILGVCLFGLRPIAGLLYARKLARSGSHLAHSNLQSSARQIANRLQIKPAVRLVESGLVHVPTVVGYFKPLILFPATILSGLSEQQLTLILTHELAHIRRHDYLINIGQTLIESLLFYHPAMWWISNQIRVERENCCDDIAAKLSGDPTSMAAALLALEETRALPPALAATGGHLISRVKRLLRQPQTQHSSGLGLSALALFAIVSILAVSTALANRPDNQDREPVETVPSLDFAQSPISLPQLILDETSAGNTIVADEKTADDETRVVVDVADEPIVKVNGSTIFRERVVDLTIELHGKKVLESMINAILLEQECERREITIRETEVLEFAQRKAETVGLTVEKHLEIIESKRKITREQILKLYRDELAIQEIFISIHGGLQITNLTSHEPTTPKSLFEELRNKSEIQIDLENEVVATVNDRSISKQQYRDESFARFGQVTLDLEISRILLMQALEQEGLAVTEKELQQVRGKQSNSTSMLLDAESDDIEVWNSLALEKLAGANLKASIQPEEIEKAMESNFGPRAKVLALITSDQKTAQKCWQLFNASPTAENFKAIAHKYSTEPVSKNYGEVPPIRKYNGRPKVEEAAFALEVGEISEILEVNNQWVIMYGLGQTEPRSEPSQEKRLQQAEAQLLEKKRLQAMQEKMQAILKNATIKRVVQAPGDQPVRVPGLNASQDQQVILKSYAVADLVVSRAPFGMTTLSEFAPVPSWDFESLVRLIKENVAQGTWDTNTLQPYEDNLSLIVSHEARVHDQIQDLLEKLRELRDVTIETSSFLIVVPKKKFDVIPRKLTDVLGISRDQVFMLHAFAIGRPEIQVQEFPMCSCFNGQSKVRTLDESTDLKGRKLEVQQTISRERDSVRVAIWDPSKKGVRGKQFSAKSGQFTAVDLTELFELDQGNERAILVFKSHISHDLE